VAAAECSSCAGLWLSNASFQQLTDEAATEAANKVWWHDLTKARDPEVERPAEKGVRYRPCAECGKLMVRQNFGRASGVIIDICKYHGVWFDADELPRILDWVQSGGLKTAAEEQAARAKRDEALHEELSGRHSLGHSEHSPIDSAASESLMSLALSGLFGRLF
jgi:Zn-finger nucleic acid-binding protein